MREGEALGRVFNEPPGCQKRLRLWGKNSQTGRTGHFSFFPRDRAAVPLAVLEWPQSLVIPSDLIGELMALNLISLL